MFKINFLFKEMNSFRAYFKSNILLNTKAGTTDVVPQIKNVYLNVVP